FHLGVVLHMIGTLLTEVVSAEEAANLRARLLAAGLERYEIADRGRYERNFALADARLFAGLKEIAERTLGARLSVSGAEWNRLCRGDYALTKDDGSTLRGPHVELCLDFSSSASEEAQAIWFNPQESFHLPHQPGTLAIVDRRRKTSRY